MRHPHAVPAIHHHRWHRVHRDDDAERDEDEKHDDEGRGHDGRRKRVRVARACDSHAPKRTREPATRKHLSKAKPFFKIRVRLRPQMAAVDLRQRES